MKIATRKEVSDSDKKYELMLKKEKHHNHEIVIDEGGNYRWKRDDDFKKLVDKIGINEIMVLFAYLGLNKNSEIVRDFYRKIGYSIFGYWEIFYWEVNNNIASEYKMPVDNKKIINMIESVKKHHTDELGDVIKNIDLIYVINKIKYLI